MSQAAPPVDAATMARRKKTVAWVIGLALAGLIFDGYDLVVYGAVLPQFLAKGGLIFNELSPEHQQALGAWAASGPHLPSDVPPPDVKAAQGAAKAVGGLLGSYALFGVLVGALIAGSFGDIIGRRKVMLISMAWFSIGMAVTAMMNTVAHFGWLRFITGLGVGALVATTGALVSEYAPPGKKNTYTAIVYAGVPIGSLLSAGLSMLLLQHIDWHGMFLIGALPLITIFPLAIWKLPESVAWLASRGKLEEAQRLSDKTGVPIPPAAAAADGEQPVLTGSDARAGWAGLFTVYFFPTLIIGFISATGLLLVYSLNTWLPALMGPLLGAQAGLALLLALNGGAIFGALFGSRFADKYGARPTVAVCFVIGAVAIFLITLPKAEPGNVSGGVIGLLVLITAVVGLGTSGTQTLIYALGSTYFRTNVRGAGVAWVAGFGRLGGVGGPILGGILAARYADNLSMVFYVLCAIGFLGTILTIILPKPKADPLAAANVVVEPSVGAKAGN